MTLDYMLKNPGKTAVGLVTAAYLIGSGALYSKSYFEKKSKPKKIKKSFFGIKKKKSTPLKNSKIQPYKPDNFLTKNIKATKYDIKFKKPRKAAISTFLKSLQVPRRKQLTDDANYRNSNVSPDGNWLLYQKKVRGQFGIYALNLQTGQEHIIKDNLLENEKNPIWVSQTEILYDVGAITSGRKTHNIRQMEVKYETIDDKTDEQKISSGFERNIINFNMHDCHPAVATETGRVAYETNEREDRAIADKRVIMIWDSANEKMFAMPSKQGEWCEHPTIDSKGKILIYKSRKAGHSSDIIYWNLDSEQNINLTNDSTNNQHSPRLSKDGKYLTYISSETRARTGYDQIFIMDLSNPLNPIKKQATFTRTYKWDPTFSPKGKLIYYGSTKIGDESSTLSNIFKGENLLHGIYKLPSNSYKKIEKKPTRNKSTFKTKITKKIKTKKSFFKKKKSFFKKSKQRRGR